MDLPWYPYIIPKNQPRYSSVTKFKYYPILGNHNDCVIMGSVGKVKNEDEYEAFQKNNVDSFVNNTYQTIKAGLIGVIDADGRHWHGY